MDSLMNKFKRDNNSKYKEVYTVGEKTHLKHVAEAINNFSELKSEIMNHNDLDGLSIKDNNKLLEKINNTNTKKLVYKLIAFEKSDKARLINLINNTIINNSKIDKELENNIKNKDDGLRYATALGIIDDYIEYLESGKYSGPVLE